MLASITSPKEDNSKMSKRPPAIEIRSHSHSPAIRTPNEPFSRPFPSPRLLHMAGDIPPEMSPLDAFAHQSRLLAQKLAEGKRGDRRMSRLPPLSADDELVARPQYLRVQTAQEAQMQPFHEAPRSPGLQNGMRLEENMKNRPMSVHPRMSKMPDAGSERFDLSELQNNRDDDRGRKSFDSRDILPSFDDGLDLGFPKPKFEKPIAASEGNSPVRPSSRQIDRGLGLSGLAPPRSPLLFATHADSENGTKKNEEPRPALRKFSTSSGMSNNSALSPLSPGLYPEYPRSPSVASDRGSSFRLSRPAFNFSRPLSRMDMPTPPIRQSSDTFERPSMTSERPSAEESGLTSLESLRLGGSYDSNNSETLRPGSSYVYSKCTLPRGKQLQRSSSSPSGVKIDFDTPSESPLKRSQTSDNHPPSPELCHSPKQITPLPLTASLKPPAKEAPPPTKDVMNLSIQPLPPTVEDEQSAEMHVQKGIALHESGSLNESTYHLRKAALANHPTGMLLYALACRHGWGMRVNQEEGNSWLRKAADLAQTELSEGKDDPNKLLPGEDAITQRQRKAQFALSIYELGQSYLNGWGIEKDAKLAVRCFEIAGAWGDGDALAEAGFCYAQGLGCKRDMKRAAGLYREAEKKGWAGVGFSW